MKLCNAIKELAIISVGNVIVAAAVFFFMLPSHVSVGSGAALAMVLSNFIPLSVSTITLIMNVGLLIIGFLLIGPEFGAKTVYCSILMPVVMGVFEKIFLSQHIDKRKNLLYNTDTVTFTGIFDRNGQDSARIYIYIT